MIWSFCSANQQLMRKLCRATLMVHFLFFRFHRNIAGNMRNRIQYRRRVLHFNKGMSIEITVHWIQIYSPYSQHFWSKNGCTHFSNMHRNISLYNLIDSRQHSYFFFQERISIHKKTYYIHIRVETKSKGNWLIMSYYYAFKKRTRWLSRNRFFNNNGVYMYTEMWGTRWRRFSEKPMDDPSG